jgi:uncharacterized RDD family membrane protein YckC
MNPALGLAAARIVIGGCAFATPDLGTKLFRLDGPGNPQLPYMTRLFGSREIVLGAATLLASGKTRRNLVVAGIAVDLADAAAAWLAGEARHAHGTRRGCRVRGRGRRRRGLDRGPAVARTPPTVEVSARHRESTMTQMPPPSAEPHQAGPGAARPGELLDRFLARLIDGLVLGVVYIVLSAIFRPVFISGVDSTGELFAFYAVVSILWTAVAIGYFAFLESSRGQTVGKMVMKLRTQGPDGANPTLAQGVRRNIFYAFELLAIVPIIGFWLGPLATFVAVSLIAYGIYSDHVSRQGWHDEFAGGTRVVKLA